MAAARLARVGRAVVVANFLAGVGCPRASPSGVRQRVRGAMMGVMLGVVHGEQWSRLSEIWGISSRASSGLAEVGHRQGNEN